MFNPSMGIQSTSWRKTCPSKMREDSERHDRPERPPETSAVTVVHRHCVPNARPPLVRSRPGPIAWESNTDSYVPGLCIPGHGAPFQMTMDHRIVQDRHRCHGNPLQKPAPVSSSRCWCRGGNVLPAGRTCGLHGFSIKQKGYQLACSMTGAAPMLLF
jgi:hypothetical protein